VELKPKMMMMIKHECVWGILWGDQWEGEEEMKRY
jgi:hypothetical protein